MMDEVRAFIDRVARVVPQVQYVGWDIVVTPDGPVLVEGNWGAGVYENKPSVTGIRTGHKARYRERSGSERRVRPRRTTPERRRLVPLAERVVPQDRHEPLLAGLVERRAQDVAAEVVDVDDGDLGRRRRAAPSGARATSRGRSGPSTTALLYGGIVPLVGPSIARALSPAMR